MSRLIWVSRGGDGAAPTRSLSELQLLLDRGEADVREAQKDEAEDDGRLLRGLERGVRPELVRRCPETILQLAVGFVLVGGLGPVRGRFLFAGDGRYSPAVPGPNFPNRHPQPHFSGEDARDKGETGSYSLAARSNGGYGVLPPEQMRLKRHPQIYLIGTLKRLIEKERVCHRATSGRSAGTVGVPPGDLKRGGGWSWQRPPVRRRSAPGRSRRGLSNLCAEPSSSPRPRPSAPGRF